MVSRMENLNQLTENADDYVLQQINSRHSINYATKSQNQKVTLSEVSGSTHRQEPKLLQTRQLHNKQSKGGQSATVPGHQLQKSTSNQLEAAHLQSIYPTDTDLHSSNMDSQHFRKQLEHSGNSSVYHTQGNHRYSTIRQQPGNQKLDQDLNHQGLYQAKTDEINREAQ